MPIGCCSCVPLVAARLAAQRPATVLDLGIGMGFYGAVVRQWLDSGVRPWATTLVGVEGWEGYRNPAWDLYDRVIVRAIEEFLSERPAGWWDAVMLLDVIEHFPLPVGDGIIELAFDATAPGGQLIIATPAVWMEQGAVYGNEYERHRSLWTPEMFTAQGFEIVTDGSPDHVGNQMILAIKHRPVS